MQQVPIMHCTLLFCIEPYSVALLVSVALQKRDSEHEFDYNAERGKFLCKKKNNVNRQIDTVMAR